MAEGGLDQAYRVPAAERRAGGRLRPANVAVTRGLVAALLAALGVVAVTAGLIEVSVAAGRSVGPLREASLPEEAQRYVFDRRAWRAVATDDLFPPVYHTTTAAPMLGAHRDFTRIGLAPAADCGSALDPGLARLVSAHRCGPVLRAGYTDATRTLVATVGVAVLGTMPQEERELNAATIGRHDDLRPRAVAFAGTPAAGFGDAQRVAYRVLASAQAPLLSFAVVGFSDGRPASAHQGQAALNQSGAQLAAIDLENMAATRLKAATDELWTKSR